jgi:anti-sigma-K factor RskA
MRPGDDDLHALTAAYAMEALDADERQRYERHLAHCDTCAAELPGFRETAGRLAAATATEPPMPLRDRVLSAAARTRQRGPAPRRVRPRHAWLAVAAAAVAGAIAAAIAFGLAAGRSNDRLAAARHERQEIAAVLAAPDSVVRKASVPTGGSATVVMSPGRHAAVFTATGLRPPPTGHRYQLWLMRPAADTSIAVLPEAADRPVMIMTGGAVAGERLGLSLEPAPGSARPTPPMILTIPL